MLSDADVVARALRGTVLEGRDVRTVRILDTPEQAVHVDILGLDVVTAWRAARPVCDQLGRWPVAVEEVPQNVYSRYFYRDGVDQMPRAILERAEHLAWPDVLDFPDPAAEDWERFITVNVEETMRRVGSAPDMEQLLQRFPAPDLVALEHVLLTYEERHQPTRDGPDPPGATDPIDLGMASDIALLPTSAPHAVPAYTHYWGSGHWIDGPERLVRAIDSWHRRYGAEPYAALSVTLDFVVSRPPQDVNEAFTLATELQPFVKPNASLRQGARALLNARHWELYDRP